VVSDRFIAFTIDPDANPFWLTRDYFPEFHETDKKIFPSIDDLNQCFEKVEIFPLLIPHDCKDGFMAAYWKRPEAYLRPEIRQSISAFSKIENPSNGLLQLADDLESGEWEKRNRSILNQNELDAGYIIISASIKT